MTNFIIVSIFFVSIFVIVEVLSRLFKIPRELSRKTTHIIIGASAAFLPYLISFQQIIILTALSLIMILISRSLKIFQSVHDVKRHSFGELFFPIGIMLTAWLFPNISAFQFGILIMAVSDGLAGLIGSSFSKRKYKILGDKKSYLGSTVFFVSAAIIGLIIYPNITMVFIALALTLVEAASVKGIDNLLLPTISAALLLAII